MCIENKIAHGNIRPSNFVFKQNTDTKSLKLMGFERAVTNEDNKLVEEHCIKLLQNIDFELIMKINKNVCIHKFILKSSDGEALDMYLSPETLVNKDIQEASDVWSIGIIFYQLIYKHHPFENDLKLAPREIKAYIKQSGPKPGYNSNSFTDRPNELIEFINKCLIWNPKNRISADEMIEEIDRLSEQSKNWALSKSTKREEIETKNSPKK